MGNWSVKDGTLILREEPPGQIDDRVFRFAVGKGKLIFRAEGSENFIHRKPEDGDMFLYCGEPIEVPEIERPRAVLVIRAGGRQFYASLAQNPSAEAFTEKLNSDALNVAMREYGGFEKVGDLPWELPRSDKRTEAKPGDIVLFGGNQITIYYGENTWDLTLLAQIGSVTREELLDAFGNGNVDVEFSLEWSE